MEIRALICLSEPSQRESSMNHCTVAHVISIWWQFEVIFQGSALYYGPQAVTGYPRGSLTHRQGWQGGAILIFILDLTFHMYAVYTQTHVCICTQTIASVYMHTQSHACIRTTHTSARMYMHTHMCVHVHTTICTIHTIARVHMYTQLHACIRTHNHMHVYVHTTAYVYVHTRINPQVLA